ncbi:Undecaprenol kinase [Posidoniimonas polymericola]|uniref:Undecaprenol kinase n=1 Tax=Posidoniimonas polymericola TaxID=2528002 RepID=A0A5C5YHX5_9BACT|nr:diacylglycerol kinase family protein [Posidoniimonas polymericola]TWT73592.1 Undecaprenol kinase [Posidoniimonas polymericola]
MFPPPKRWSEKYRCALRGLAVAVRGEDSFWVHLPAAVVVIGLAAWLRVSAVEWLLLVLSIGVVWTAELFNTALEHLAKAVTREPNDHVGNALDVAAAAVLVAAGAAKVVGTVIFATRLFGW